MTLGHQLSENVLSKYTQAAWSTMNWFKKNKDSGEPGGSDSGALAGQSGPTSIERRRVTEMLVLICEGNYGAIVSNTELDASWRGQFSWAEDDTVALEVELNEVEAVLEAAAIAERVGLIDQHAHHVELLGHAYGVSVLFRVDAAGVPHTLVSEHLADLGERTVEIGPDGEAAVKALLQDAAAAGLIPTMPPLHWVG